MKTVKYTLFALLLIVIPVNLWAVGPVSGFCQNGNQTVAVGGLTSTTKVQRSFPVCTVTVFLSGTVTLATLYSDNAASPTPLANPFTATSTGNWTFYSLNGLYDVVLSNGGITVPFTIGTFAVIDTVTTPFNRNACSAKYTAANMGLSIAAARADLPTMGGVVDARCFTGAQTSTGDWFGGHTGVLVLISATTITSSNTIIIPGNSAIEGIGDASVIAANNLTAEIVRINGNNAAISNVWVKGPGAITNFIDGRRGIWIGCGSTTHSSPLCFADYTLVENVTITGTIGNGISGDYRHARILKNVITDTGDAGIFVQPASIYNLFEGNTILRAAPSGFDINGSHNRFIGNTSSNNGGISLDANSQSGFLVTYISTDPTQPNGNENEFVGNRADSNVGCGFVVYNGSTTAGVVNSPYGNVFTANTATGHTNQYTQNPNITLNQYSGGFCIFGGNHTTFNSNTSGGNTFNYIGSGISNNTSPGNIWNANQSFNAVTNAALTSIGKPSGQGYYFPGSARIDSVGGSPATNFTLTNNQDSYPAAECYRWSLDGATGLVWSGWTITGNKCNSPGTYGFRVVDPNSFGANYFNGSNYSTGASPATNNYSGFNALGLTANSTTPSVANAISVRTQNTVATTITNFTDPTPGQVLNVEVGDVNTTFDFTGSNLKGNAGVDFTAYTGDFIQCIYDGTNWYCTTSTQDISGGYANGVMQAPTTQGAGLGKGTTVTPTIAAIRTRIILNNAALAGNTTIPFTFVNSKITGDSRVICTHFNAGTQGSYHLDAFPLAGSATITVRNITSGSLSEAIQIDCRIDPTQ